MKKILGVFFTGMLLTLTGCGSLFTIGESEFSCPHVRSNIRCMPPSEVEKLDEAGKLDWRWHPYPGEAVKSDLCSLANAEAYIKLCGPGGALQGEELCKVFAEKCITSHKTVSFKGTVSPEGTSPLIEFDLESE